MKYWNLTLAAIILILSNSANAALVGRLAATEGGTDYQAYYDTEANLTWLADATAAGIAMNWDDASNWVANLNVDGVTGWRLYDTGPYCGGPYNCTDSEMGNLFYNVLGGVAGSSITDVHNANYDLFSNILTDHYYWSLTEFAPDPVDAWHFHMDGGSHDPYHKYIEMYAWAVYSGDVGLAAVPVPTAVWLFSSGLIGLIGIARRKKS
ncbi:MAG: hypothetical protein OQK76_07330 [Gammaproteobacteria bacterium]|nr:hypothetical protein [Gammaproteobacteria bacterium]MCW9004509.1 hypothetical protein [Gammaproteobacteria bacterium]MCW9056053.1 hypothetical protein [Gammaproteobacteria bacterium]